MPFILVTGEPIELDVDVDADDAVAAGDTGFLIIRRAAVFAL
jgi:hypothetical protein